jgi:UDP-N-acetylmuramoyl-L-alanyl-D-glutamate--2,6-diaminopimelate ligase
MRLAELLAGQPVSGDPGAATEVTGLQLDSRRVVPGDLFVAIQGAKADGRKFAAQAVQRGAVAVLAAGPAEGQEPGVPWLTTADPRALLAPLAFRLHGTPDRELLMVGVTGTNGKSTVVWTCQALLEAAGRPTARLGTVSYTFRDLDLPAQRTTPEISDLLHMLRRMRDRGAEAACLEVSSHALALGRVDGVSFDVGVFTNLTRDHLDFHGSMEEYFAAKRRLFTEHLKPGATAVVNVGDPWGRKLAAELPRVIGYGEGGDVRAAEAMLDADGIRARVVTPRGDLAIESSLLGPFNLENLLATVAVGEALGLPLDAVARGLRDVRPVPGRMEKIDRGQSFPVFVDYAHTDDALASTLRAVRRISRRKVAVVFGCGGDRDRGKRPLMGKVAGELADLVIVTSDNPRSEDPLSIMAAVEEGLKASGNAEYRMLPDRRDAIRRALAIAAGDEWAVLVAGKGNEEGQEIAGVVQPFSDRDEIAKALEERRAANAG